MSKFFVVYVLLVAACLCMVSAASIGGRHGDLLDAETAIQKIIAEYEKLGGTSLHHPREIATFIDPNHFHL